MQQPWEVLYTLHWGMEFGIPSKFICQDLKKQAHLNQPGSKLKQRSYRSTRKKKLAKLRVKSNILQNP